MAIINKKEATVTITLEEYEQLMDDSNKLYYLEMGGVDNWEWYGEALTEYWKEKEEEEED